MIKFNYVVMKIIQLNILNQLLSEKKNTIQNLSVIQSKSWINNIKLFK